MITHLITLVGILQGVTSVVVLAICIVVAFCSCPIDSEEEERFLMRSLSWPMQAPRSPLTAIRLGMGHIDTDAIADVNYSMTLPPPDCVVLPPEIATDIT